jgi:hypothetical protein
LVIKNLTFVKPKLLHELNAPVLDFDKTEIKKLSSIEKTQVYIEGSVKKLKIRVSIKKLKIKELIESPKVDLELNIDKKSSIKEKKKKGEILFEVGRTLDIKKPIVDKSKLSSALNILV